MNVKWYSRQQCLLDLRVDAVPDHYLVMTGPNAPPSSSRGKDQPWSIDSVYLFEAKQLHEALTARGRRSGIATSVVRAHWRLAEVNPDATSALLVLSDTQRKALSVFHSNHMSVS